jgi:hypothetical protein
MQSRARRRIVAIDDRPEIGEPETSERNDADQGCEDGIEHLAVISLQVAYFPALAQPP